MDVSRLSYNLPDFTFRADEGYGGLDYTATTTTAVMPAVHDSGASGSLAVDATLSRDPSFVDIGHPGSRHEGHPNLPSTGTTNPNVNGSALNGTAGRTTSSSSSASLPFLPTSTSRDVRCKLRSTTTPTPTQPPPYSSSKSRTHHRSTRSHGGQKDSDVPDDLLLDLLKEFRAAKKREREGVAQPGAATVSLGQGVKSLLSHGSGRSKTPNPIPSRHGAQAVEIEEPKTQRTRQRSASSASTRPRTQSHSKGSSSAGTTDSLALLLQHLKQETARANSAEMQLRESIERLRVCRQEKWNAEGQLAVVREELELYKVQLDLAQKEILRAQKIVNTIDLQRVQAEANAERYQKEYRKAAQENLVARALEEGRREGFEEGCRRGREVAEMQMEEIREREAQEEWTRERERKRRERERELQREREREEIERERRELERLREQEKRERQERERRERERVERERVERERREKEKFERQRLEKERLERQRLEKERLERERLERERMEREREQAQRERERPQEQERFRELQREQERQEAAQRTAVKSRSRSNTVNGALPSRPQPSALSIANPADSTSNTFRASTRSRSDSVPAPTAAGKYAAQWEAAWRSGVRPPSTQPSQSRITTPAPGASRSPLRLHTPGPQLPPSRSSRTPAPQSQPRSHSQPPRSQSVAPPLPQQQQQRQPSSSTSTTVVSDPQGSATTGTGPKTKSPSNPVLVGATIKTGTTTRPYFPMPPPPPPPPNYIPVATKDGGVPIPAPHGFRSPPKDAHPPAPAPPPPAKRRNPFDGWSIPSAGDVISHVLEGGRNIGRGKNDGEATYADPERERRRQQIVAQVSNPHETPTPRPNSSLPRTNGLTVKPQDPAHSELGPGVRGHDTKGKGVLRVIDETTEPSSATTSDGFPWYAPARKVEEPSFSVDVTHIPADTSRSHGPRASSSGMPYSSTPRGSGVEGDGLGADTTGTGTEGGEESRATASRKSSSPPVSGRSSRAQSMAESMWLLPPDHSYAGGAPELSGLGTTPRLVRSATSGTTPEIGVEPPSQSPTTADDSDSRVLDSGLLTPEGGPPPNLPRPTQQQQRRSGGNQQGHPTPIYGRPQDEDVNDNEDFQYYSPSIRQSVVLPPGAGAGAFNWHQQPPAGEWAPPPVVPLSPIPGSVPVIANFGMVAPAPAINPAMGLHGSTVLSTHRQGPNDGILGLKVGSSGSDGTSAMADSPSSKRKDVFGSYTSPAPLNRPFSIFSDSDGS